ncbi:HEAT repeat domain-containing protein [bacterium]|nr:HEAT repeat domain-containing protein [bacterium]
MRPRDLLLTILLVVPSVLLATSAADASATPESTPPAAPESAHSTTPESMSEAMDDALRAIAMTRSDLGFRTDYADNPDSFRLAIADHLLETPLETNGYVHELADDVAQARDLTLLVALAARELDLGVGIGTCGMEPPGGITAVGELLSGIKKAEAELERAFERLTGDEIKFVMRHAPVLLEEEEFDPDKPIGMREKEEEDKEILGDELLRIAGSIDYSRIATAGAILASATDAALAIIEASRPGDMSSVLPPDMGGSDGRSGFALEWVATGDVLEIIETDAGLIVIGGPGATAYHRTCAIIIDLGGNDTYEQPASGRWELHPFSIVVDVAGDDTYSGGDHALGAGFGGVGVLVDIEGDDSYASGSFSIGSGLFGVGILLDKGGNDHYVGDTCVQGAGAFGIGIQLDESGNDSYHAALFSQAVGFVKGFGVLYDSLGNDIYFAGGKYTDEIRYFDHFLSLSQGFGFGWRPDASGGIGLLVDSAGNDVYVSDIFGQGSSYWFSVGGLVDFEGNDQYISYQYAQGAATHITAAALVDCAGDDNYVSKGVSQGCGHDLAVGILHDLAGDDNYICHDLSQAAGNANGIGILLDDGGNDTYSVRNSDKTHGYGNLRRDYASVGVLIDGGGTDSYGGRGDNDIWWTHSDRGVGIDTEISISRAEAEQTAGGDQLQDAEVDTLALAALSPEELFDRASSSALQFAAMIQPSRRLLIRNHAESLPYLVTELDTDGARERHALEDVIVRIGTPAVGPLIEAIAVELKRTDTTRGARLAAGILGRLGDPEALDALTRASGHDEWKTRSAAASAIGRMAVQSGVPVLALLLDDENEMVRKSAAVGLRRTAAEDASDGAADDESVDNEGLDDEAIAALIRALSDTHYAVRQSAGAALAVVGEPAIERLTHLAIEGDSVSRLMAIETLGTIGAASSLETMLNLLEDDDWAVRACATEGSLFCTKAYSTW